ncbi:MAG: PAS domain-containing protein [Gemmataceae bacterium]
MTERPRILVFETTQESPGELFAQCQSDYEIVRVNSITEGLDLLQTEPFHGVIAHPLDLAVWERANSLIHSNYILQLLADGIALVDHDLRIRWANASFEKICGGEVVGRGFYEAIQSPEILGPDYCPFHTGLVGRTVVTLLHRRQSQYLQLIVIPVPDQHGQIRHLLSQVRDITADVQRQQKLDALNQAG